MRRIALALLLATVGGAVALVAVVVVLGTPDAPPPGDVPGHATATLEVAHRGTPVPVSIWYPAEPSAPPEWIGRNALFLGHAVRPGARPRPGPAPVALLSHGSGGTGERMGWLAAGLARAGWIVVAPDHPGTRSRDSRPDATVRVWERTEDMTALLDALPDLLPDGLEPDGRIAAVGFSLGGHTALALGGARLSKAAFQADCAARDDYDCGWLARGGVDLSEIEAARYESDLSDARVDAVVAIDPALAAAMTPESLRDVDLPVLLLSMGDPPPAALRADGLAEALPDATPKRMPGASHFAMLAECSALGRLLIGLAARPDEDICTADATPRARTQDRTLGATLAFLEERMPPR